jgi:CheY-like chemotaxis protein
MQHTPSRAAARAITGRVELSRRLAGASVLPSVPRLYLELSELWVTRTPRFACAAAPARAKINTPIQFIGATNRFLDGVFADLRIVLDAYASLLQHRRRRHDIRDPAPRGRDYCGAGGGGRVGPRGNYPQRDPAVCAVVGAAPECHSAAMSARPPLALAWPPAGQPPRARTRVVLAEDHAGMRRSLRMLLEGESDIEVVAEAPEVSMAITHVHGYRPDVLVFDLRMSGGNGIDVIRRVHSQTPRTSVVVITMQDGRAFAEQAHDAGALGYVMKDTADEELADAVRRAARDQTYTSPRVTPQVFPVAR